jgi:hypothetical protein
MDDDKFKQRRHGLVRKDVSTGGWKHVGWGRRLHSERPWV